MRSVGLITDPSVTLEMFRSVLSRWFEVAIAGEAVGLALLVIQGGDKYEDRDKYAWLDPLGDIREEYEDGELDVVGMDRMSFFDLRYRSIAFLKRVLLTIADDQRVWVDLDDGTIMPGPELVARLQREPDWLMGQPTVTGD